MKNEYLAILARNVIANNGCSLDFLLPGNIIKNVSHYKTQTKYYEDVDF